MSTEWRQWHNGGQSGKINGLGHKHMNEEILCHVIACQFAAEGNGVRSTSSQIIAMLPANSKLFVSQVIVSIDSNV